MEIEGANFSVNWVSASIFFVLGLAIAWHGRRASGSWTRPWLGLRPLWWFVVLFLLPFVGYLMLAVGLISRKRTSGGPA
ncbi:MAG: hypothetical protein ACRCY8_20090 [Dermatophilaceae bacterium]